jgi:hypothetical protein
MLGRVVPLGENAMIVSVAPLSDTMLSGCADPNDGSRTCRGMQSSGRA